MKILTSTLFVILFSSFLATMVATDELNVLGFLIGGLVGSIGAILLVSIAISFVSRLTAN